MHEYDEAFARYGKATAQVLLTRDDLRHRQRFLNARNTMRRLLDWRVIPIVNENDAVATEEIKVGDNDNLSAMVATLVSADLLLILTDQAGLYTADPRTDPTAELIPEVHRFEDLQHIHAGDSTTGLGVGGMSTKLAAANTARHAGIDVVIAAGSEPDIILRVANGEAVGTRFLALESRIESRKRWILAGPKPSGRIVVDAGAVRALCRRGRSLLPAGITAVEGPFQRGDTVIIVDSERHELARGLTAYNSEDLVHIAGCQSHEIEDRLGYTYGEEAIHRNNLVLLTE